jgi:cobalamin biosynthesis protein CobT
MMSNIMICLEVRDDMGKEIIPKLHDRFRGRRGVRVVVTAPGANARNARELKFIIECPDEKSIGHAGSVLQDFTNAFVDQSRSYYRDHRCNAMKKSAMDKLREAFYDEPEKVAFIEQFLKGNEPPESNDPLVAFTATSIFDNAPENIKRMTGSINDALRYALFHATMTDEGKKGTD